MNFNLKEIDYQTAQKKRSRLRNASLWTFGVIMPLIVLGVEMVTGMCAQAFFNPIATWVHLLLVLFVPLSCGWLIFKKNEALENNALTQVPLIAAVTGASIVISMAYAFLFLFLLPLSLIALIVFGLGLLSLTPILSAITTWRIRILVKEQVGNLNEWNQWFYCGVSLAVAILFLLEAGPIWTRAGAMKAMSTDAETAQKGLDQLRRYASERTLAREVAETIRFQGGTDISGWIFQGWSFLSFNDSRYFDIGTKGEQTKKLYYQVTGEAHNSFEASWLDVEPIMARLDRGEEGSRGFSDEVIFDSHLGSEEVASKVSGLTMKESLILGHLDSASGLGYQEWTVVFNNDSSRDREARMQVQLPPNGHVSRVTLWINGEPCEAAFASKSTVRKAYQEIAVVQRRDPLLVTASGPNRVLVQCFPILAKGEMKIRLGISAPLYEGAMHPPTILEQNFRPQKGLRHQVHYQSTEALFVGKKKSTVEEGQHRAQWRGTDLSQAKARFFKEEKPAQIVWCRDQFAATGKGVLRRELIREAGEPLERCAVVIDGSAGLARHRHQLSRVLAQQFAMKVKVFIADDGVKVLEHPEDLKDWDFSGGRDNTKALLQALQWAESSGNPQNGAVVWINAAQPVDFGELGLLEDFFEKSTQEVSIHALSLGKGRSFTLEKLFKYRAVKMAPPMDNFEQDLSRFLNELSRPESKMEPQWTRHATSDELPEGEVGQQVWDQLARDWAAQKVESLSYAEKQDAAHISFAANYQLVTAFSGAVVLENAEQYKKHGLNPVENGSQASVPSVPEPSISLFLIISGMLALGRRTRGAVAE